MQDYLQWRSALSLDDVFKAQEQVSYPDFFANKILFLTSLVDEKNRSVLKFGAEGDFICITPAPYSLRTQINEYGGKPYWLDGYSLIFANQADQCLYRQDCVDEKFSPPQRISTKPNGQITYMYSDVQPVGGGRFMCVIEAYDATKSASQNECFIGVVDANQPDQAPEKLIVGADFYSNLVVNKQQQLAWVQWSHPMMPWDENQAFTAHYNVDTGVSDPTEVVLEPGLNGASHCQLAFSRSGLLYLSADFQAQASNEQAQAGNEQAQAGNEQAQAGNENYWNVYVWNPRTQSAQRLTDEQREFGYPQWQYGDVRIVEVADGTLCAIGSDVRSDALFLLNAEYLRCEKIYDHTSTINSLASDGQGQLLALETRDDGRTELVAFTLTDDPSLTKHTIVPGADYPHPVSRAQAVRFTCRDGNPAHGFYYAPVNHHAGHNPKPSEQIASEALDTQPTLPPPLLVMVHGGPTARAYGHFDVQKQFWCANGFAVFDVNHRGSSGYGRNYRDALYGHWGELDTSDIIDGIQDLVNNGLADVERVCICGKSAGGYAVLRALTEYPQTFKAGACYYGIGNLATLSEITHKFEKHYTDRLIDEPYNALTASQASSRYFTRSPIHRVGQISSAMIIFQGGEDKIVPPPVAHEVVEQLAANGVEHEYIEYPDEGHGFRQAANNIDAWSRELNFYRRILSE